MLHFILLPCYTDSHEIVLVVRVAGLKLLLQARMLKLVEVLRDFFFTLYFLLLITRRENDSHNFAPWLDGSLVL
jgi:hypothetical protein